MKVVIISGSSRNNGDTAKMVNQLAAFYNWDLIDLNDYEFTYYDYQFRNKNDDFMPLIKRIIRNYDVHVYASPVYWYSMSGNMKVFFDRITNLLDHKQELGRKLRAKKMAALTVSNGDNLGEHYWLPFIETAKYLGMEWLTGLHTISKHDSTIQLKQFARHIQQVK